MIGMPKAFDTVNPKIFLKKLETTLDLSKMRMMNLLINNVKLKVRVGRSLGEEILVQHKEIVFPSFCLYSIWLNSWM